MKLKNKKFESYHAINLLKKFRHKKIEIIKIPNFYNSGKPIYGKIINDHKLAFFLNVEANTLSLRLYYKDKQNAYTIIIVSKKEIEIMQRVFEMVKNEN